MPPSNAARAFIPGRWINAKCSPHCVPAISQGCSVFVLLIKLWKMRLAQPRYRGENKQTNKKDLASCGVVCVCLKAQSSPEDPQIAPAGGDELMEGLMEVCPSAIISQGNLGYPGLQEFLDVVKSLELQNKLIESNCALKCIFQNSAFGGFLQKSKKAPGRSLLAQRCLLSLLCFEQQFLIWV